MSNKVVVRFLKAWRGYSAEELAGFDEEVAEGLKSKGFAEAYEKPKTGKGSAKASGAKNSGETGTAGSPTESSGAASNGAEGGEVNSGTDDDAKP